MNHPCKTMTLFLTLAMMAASLGCSDEQITEMNRRNQKDKERWNEFWATEKNSDSRSATGRRVGESEVWTIECNSYEGPERREMADKMAEALQRVRDLRSNDIWVEHSENHSCVFYGNYKLRYFQTKVDGESHVEGDVIIKLNNEIKRDMRYIKTLAFGDKYPFFSARAIAKPIRDVGPSEWDLRNAKGAYSLHVGITYNTPNLQNYKQAAIEWVKDLRRRGHEAYYYHDPDKPQTSICVGTFGEDAVTEYDAPQNPNEPKTTARRRYSEAVLQLRSQEEFMWNLENGHKISRGKTGEDGKPVMMANESFLVPIPKQDTPQTGW